jgi:hypothetical protein
MRGSNKRGRKYRKTRRLRKSRKAKHSGGTTHKTVYPPDSIKTYISNVVYVNLDSRTDRRAQIEQELKIFNPEQVHRVPGIVPEIMDMPHKSIALAKAHLSAVKLAKEHNWPNTLFLEDDSVWANIDKAYPAFEALVKKSYDAIMLSSHNAKYDAEFRAESATSGAAYLLHNSHYSIFIDKLQAMIDSFVSGVTGWSNSEADAAVFGPLQKEYKWYIVVPALMTQLPGVSDRVGTYQNFTGSDPKPQV